MAVDVNSIKRIPGLMNEALAAFKPDNNPSNEEWRSAKDLLGRFETALSIPIDSRTTLESANSRRAYAVLAAEKAVLHTLQRLTDVEHEEMPGRTGKDVGSLEGRFELGQETRRRLSDLAQELVKLQLLEPAVVSMLKQVESTP